MERQIQPSVVRRRYVTPDIQPLSQLIQLPTETARTICGYTKKNIERCDRLQGAIEGISLTFSDSDPDMITLDCSERVRANMPCGHVIGPQSLFDYCTNLLKRGFSEFACADPGCSAVWDYATVRHVACLALDESRTFESRLSENLLNKMSGMQMCAGGCDNWVCREDSAGNMVKCLTCSETKGYTYYFCWSCLHEWKDGTGGKCGNDDCSTSARVQSDQEHLDNCPDHEIGGVMSPSVRACPQCSVLIEHVAKCSHMTCCNCQHEFCFVCLKRYAGFAAASSLDACASAGAASCVGPAPRQTLRPEERDAAGIKADAAAAPVVAHTKVLKSRRRLGTTSVQKYAAAAAVHVRQSTAAIVPPQVYDDELDMIPVREETVPAARRSSFRLDPFSGLRPHPVAAPRHRPLRRFQVASKSSDEPETE